MAPMVAGSNPAPAPSIPSARRVIPGEKEKAEMVRAKMKVMAIQPFHSGDPEGVCSEVRLFPVFNDSPENKTWSKYTARLASAGLVITNPEAIDAFEVGKEYFLDFTSAS